MALPAACGGIAPALHLAGGKAEENAVAAGLGLFARIQHGGGSGLEWLNPNSMLGSDNESRLMTGRYGPKKALGPTQMIKYEWDQINLSTNVK